MYAMLDAFYHNHLGAQQRSGNTKLHYWIERRTAFLSALAFTLQISEHWERDLHQQVFETIDFPF